MTLRLRASAVLLAAALAITACAPEPAPAPEAPAAPQPEAVAPAPASPEAAVPASSPAAPAEAGPVYLDVRTPEEFAAGHVEGAVLLPYDQIAGRIAELEPYRERDMVVYCRTGRRSGIAIETLRANGFSRLTNGGGLEEVVRTHNLPVATGN